MMVADPAPGRPYALVTGAAGEDPLAEREAIVALYKAHGALLLRGFAIDLPRFRTFTASLCPTSVFNESRGRTVLDAEANILSVAPGDAAFPLHPELAREPWRPDACFFACFSSPAAGGETLICDGIALADALPEPIRDAFAAQRLRYLQPALPEELAYWLGTPDPDAALLAAPPPGCPYRFVSNGERIWRFFTRPALHKPMFAERPAFGNFLLFARYHRGENRFPTLADGTIVPDDWVAAAKAAGDRVSAAIAWQQGDLLMLDNSRFMHGRNAIRDKAERRIASHFGYLDFAVPDVEEVHDAPWRRPGFRPPVLAPKPAR